MSGLLTAESPEVAEFVAAYQENRNLAASSSWLAGGWRIAIVAETRRKYVLVDETDAYNGEPPRLDVSRSGRFMVDRSSGEVFTIRGYGQRGHRIGSLAGLTASYRAGSATYVAGSRTHMETGHSLVASWPAGGTKVDAIG